MRRLCPKVDAYPARLKIKVAKSRHNKGTRIQSSAFIIVWVWYPERN